jgi:cytochrome c-type biogenesis protein CcmH/NrfG
LNQKTVLAVVAVVVVALGAYWVGTQSSSSKVAPPMPGAGAPMGGMPQGMPPGVPPGAMPGAMNPGPGIEAAQRIAAAEALVQKDPKNVQAWVQLGNDYFDTHQAQKSVDAYAKALALKPNDPDVLTDQGVMYRELGKYDQAVANFEKASKLNPSHVQSLFNAGIVYAYDLKQPQKAAPYWNRVIQLAPGSPQAVQARQHLETLGQK